jgi:hypothetical protein
VVRSSLWHINDGSSDARSSPPSSSSSSHPAPPSCSSFYSVGARASLELSSVSKLVAPQPPSVVRLRLPLGGGFQCAMVMATNDEVVRWQELGGQWGGVEWLGTGAGSRHGPTQEGMKEVGNFSGSEGDAGRRENGVGDPVPQCGPFLLRRTTLQGWRGSFPSPV